MFGIGMPELLIILVVALIVVGPRKLPDIAKGLGKGLSEFRKATDEIKSQINENETFKDVQNMRDDFKQTVDSMNPRSLLDTDATELQPKEPQVDLSGRAEVMGAIEAEQIQSAEAEPAQSAEAEAAVKPAEKTDQTPPTPPQAKPDASKKADA